MILVGIDVGKPKHTYSAINSKTGELIVEPTDINNNESGFDYLYGSIKKYKKDNVLIGMEDTGHYHFALLKWLLDKKYTVALINPVITDCQRRLEGSVSKNDKLDSKTICNVLSNTSYKKPYRISKIDKFDLYEQRQLTREHHNLKEDLNVLANRLQKSIDIVFPEYNSLFKAKYGTVYMDVLEQFGSASNIASSDIRNIRKCFDISGRGNRIDLTAEKLKEAAKKSIGMPSTSEAIQIKHLIRQIKLLKEQIAELDKKIEEFSKSNNSPILIIPGISHFSGTSILSEIGNINNFNNYKQIIKFAGVSPIHHESSQFNAKHTKISKKGSKYLRKTLYQIILPVINNNPTFKAYYNLKRQQGKSHRCALGHCVRKLIRVIFHILKTGETFDPMKLA